MKILSEKEQIRNRLSELDRIISWQETKTKSAKRRYAIKSEWVFSFWIWDNSDLLRSVWRWEQDNLKALKDYQDILRDKLTVY